MAQNIKFGDMDVQIPSLNFKKFGGLVPLLVIILIALSSFYTVDANENGVVLRLGKYSHTTMPGLHFKIPVGPNIEASSIFPGHDGDRGLARFQSC